MSAWFENVTRELARQVLESEGGKRNPNPRFINILNSSAEEIINLFYCLSKDHFTQVLKSVKKGKQKLNKPVVLDFILFGIEDCTKALKP